MNWLLLALSCSGLAATCFYLVELRYPSCSRHSHISVGRGAIRQSSPIISNSYSPTVGNRIAARHPTGILLPREWSTRPNQAGENIPDRLTGKQSNGSDVPSGTPLPVRPLRRYRSVNRRCGLIFGPFLPPITGRAFVWWDFSRGFSRCCRRWAFGFLFHGLTAIRKEAQHQGIHPSTLGQPDQCHLVPEQTNSHTSHLH